MCVIYVNMCVLFYMCVLYIGWKLVHGDVFRPPLTSPMLLSVLAGENPPSNLLTIHTYCSSILYVIRYTLYTLTCVVIVGSGLQILAMTVCTMVCALLGLTSPANRGALMTTLLLLYVFMGSVAGYASARVYKLFGGKDWKVSEHLYTLSV